MLNKILLGFGVLSNTATLIGLWIAYISAPTPVQAKIGHILLIAGAILSVLLYLLFAWLVLRTSNAGSANDALHAAEDRIAKLEHLLAEEQARKELDLPAQRPKIVPVRFDRTQDHRCGLFIRNHGEPAFDISMEEPVSVGSAKLTFWERIYPGLTREDGELFIDSLLQISPGYSLTADALREEMIKANLETVTLKIKYRDFDNQDWATTFDFVCEVWGKGLRVSSIQQQRLPKSSN